MSTVMNYYNKMKDLFELIDILDNEESLHEEDYAALIKGISSPLSEYACSRAERKRKLYFGNSIYVRGLIEISNYCKNDCFYCGIRKSNRKCSRYRLTKEEILECCSIGYKIGMRTFVLQGGEDGFYTDEVMADIISSVKQLYQDCAITLSIGERSKESYEILFKSGADRYLLRHETACSGHYRFLHPDTMSLEERMECLQQLKEIGFQTGCGFMVGSPGQTALTLAKDLKYIERFKPHMCGIGPFIPHKDTPFKDMPAGSLGLTIFLLALVRLIHPKVLLPATTALASLHTRGRQLALRAGANVVMPNLSPVSVRKKYELYDGKLHSGMESASYLEELKKEFSSIGYEIVVSRGDSPCLSSFL